MRVPRAITRGRVFHAYEAGLLTERQACDLLGEDRLSFRDQRARQRYHELGIDQDLCWCRPEPREQVGKIGW